MVAVDRPSDEGTQRRQLPSTAREGQSERDHLLGVANQQDVPDQDRVVPSLALD